MALRHCEDCSKDISTSARRCPHCGWVTRWGVADIFVGVPIITLFVMFYITYFGL